MCGKEAEVKDILRNLLIRPVDATLCSLYQNTLLETINRNECIRENVTSEHIKTRQKVSCKLRKLEDRIESLETSSREIKAEVQDLRKLITGIFNSIYDLVP
ncbi:uncharacterized protein LOC143084293 [Mytilus galloprovincialis]|uniref:uncharacterized protein LOC143084293 n=1 Tax=Mytilus galloprovincialis TaxID=29158 RepID=UPI003F7BE455